MTTLPGFIYKDIPKTTAEAIAHNSLDESLNIVKMAIQDYLLQFFSPKGEYREIFKVVSPGAVQFITDLRPPTPDEYRDPTKYELQISRMWQGLKQRMPCVIINEAGWSRTSSISDISAGVPVPGDSKPRKGILWLTNFLMGSIELRIGSMDETTTGQIGSELNTIFGSLRDLTKSSIISPPSPTGTGGLWEVRISGKIDIGTRERVNVGDDPQDSIWQLSLSLNDIHFEEAIPLEMPQEPSETPPIGTDAREVSLNLPNKIKLGRPVGFSVTNQPFDAVIYSDDPRVALVKDFKIIPRKIGTFNLIVGSSYSASETGITIYVQEELEVTMI